jgi:glycolate oxidase iron-sulfur subunit
MRTNFTPTQLTDPHVAEAEKNLRVCVHCGICTATCPTYVLLGDERDGPRGRIVMIQNMLEAGVAPSADTVLHVDRCLSCLACRTACPSGVDYARLIDEARDHIQTTFRRPFGDKMLRWFIATVMTRPTLVRAGLFAARFAAPFAFLLPGRLALMTAMGAHAKRQPTASPQRAILPNAKRVALMPGCVQPAIAPQIDQAVARCLARRGIELVPLEGAGCCGSLVHHLGRSEDAKKWARRAIEAFEHAGGAQALDGVLITATGCSAYLKDLESLFLDELSWLPRATFSIWCPPVRLRHRVACAWHGRRLARCRIVFILPKTAKHCSLPPGSMCSRFQRGISAAVRPEVIRFCNRRFPAV